MWEYRIHTVTVRVERLDTLGKKGWELITIYDGYMYFKRSKLHHYHIDDMKALTDTKAEYSID